MSYIRRRREFSSMSELLDEVDEFMERMIERFFWERPGWNTTESSLEPLSNVFITTDNVSIIVDVPYVEAGSIKLERKGEDSILLTAKLRRQICFDDLGINCRTGTFSTYKAEIKVPEDIDLDQVELENRGNILFIVIPREKVKQLTGDDIE